MTAPALKVGTLVLIVGTDLPAVNGATGTVADAPDRWRVVRICRECLLPHPVLTFGYRIRLARPIDDCENAVVPRRCLIPLEPPAGTADEHAREGLGVGAPIV